MSLVLFFFNDSPTTAIYTLSLHDALPICHLRLRRRVVTAGLSSRTVARHHPQDTADRGRVDRSEEHTSELQSPDHLVCRLLLEKKKNQLIHADQFRSRVTSKAQEGYYTPG